MGRSRKEGGETGLSVALFGEDAELLGLWTRGGGGQRNGGLRRAAGVLAGRRACASVGVYRLVWDGVWVWSLVC